MTFRLYQYPRCSTCRNASRWLTEHDVTHESFDLVADPLTATRLRDLWQRSGLPLRRFFNTSGESYRNGGFKDTLPAMSEPQALAALAADGKLVKRPILDAGDRVIVGFDKDAYAALA